MQVGGQAFSNGVMMAANRLVVIIRKNDGQLLEKVVKSSSRRSKIPVVRGIIVIIRQIILSLRLMMFSLKYANNKKGIILPLLVFLIYYIAPFIFNFEKLPFDPAFIDLFTLLVLLVTIYKNKFTQNMLMYHGAEHKTVNCYETGYELTLENVQKCSKEHIRCGTSLVVVVIFLNILLESTMVLFNIKDEFALYILIIPITLAIAYEIIMLAQKKPDKKIYQLILNIGLKSQKLTTIEPTADQIEVAIEALKKALAYE